MHRTTWLGHLTILTILPLLTSCSSDYDLLDGPGYGQLNPLSLDNPTQLDRIIQASSPEVDVLWIVDNSCSMYDEQQAIVNNLRAFIDFFLDSGLDYHLGVVSTDMDAVTHQGRLREVAGHRWIEPNTPSPVGTFGQMVQLGTLGSTTERGREASFSALETHANGYNQGWYRRRATLHQIVVSDEDDSSSELAVPLQEFGTYLLGLKPEQDMVTWSSIVTPPNCSPSCGDGSPGLAYLTLSREVGGISWDIRTQDWSGLLQELGMVASGTSREFFLSRLPDEDTIEVWSVDPDGDEDTWREGAEWLYDRKRNSVSFVDRIPGPLEEVFIEYTPLASWVQ